MGFGPGRDDYATTATTATIEESKAIDINEFTDTLRPGTRGSYQWTRDGEESGTIRWEVTGDAGGERARGQSLWLQFTVTDHRTDEQREYEYPIPLEYTACNFGGKRPWFRCPGVVNGEECNRRVGKLYCPPGHDLFLCRHCYDLGYTSSRTSGDDMKQAELRFRNAHAKIDGERTHPGQYYRPPERPTGMHRSTYERLCEDLEATYREWNEASHTKLVAHAQRLRAVID